MDRYRKGKTSRRPKSSQGNKEYCYERVEKGTQSAFAQKGATSRRWSARVTRESHALDLTAGIFTANDPQRIARSLKRSAERSHRRKADPYRSALSMLVFYINRAGCNLSKDKKRILEQAKVALRKLFGKDKAP